MEIRTIASGSAGNCYYISDGITPLLIEAGIGYRQIQQALDFKIKQLQGCLITHEHKDHSYAAHALIKSRVPVFMTKGTEYGLCLTDKDRRCLFNIKAGESFPINSWAILPFETQHDAIEPVGFLLASSTGEKLLYATDTHYIAYRFQGITHLMIEANYCEKILDQRIAAQEVSPALADRLYSNHLNLRRVKEFLAANRLDDLEEIHLLHLSEENADAAGFKREIERQTGVPVYIAGEVMAPEVRLHG